MDQDNLGPLGSVSCLTLGGGGLGQLWGRTDRDECVATLRAAVDGGIDLIDLAGIGHPDAIINLLADSPAPAVVQCIANATYSPGALYFMTRRPGPGT